jgi:hypothetical protein
MTATTLDEVLRGVRAAGIMLSLDGENLIARPSPLVTPEIVATLKEVKPAVLQVLREDEQLRRTGILQCERQVFELAREYFR